MVELVDTRDLKSLGHRLCRFKPGSGYQKTKAATGQILWPLFYKSYSIFFSIVLPSSRQESPLKETDPLRNKPPAAGKNTPSRVGHRSRRRC